MTSYEGFLKRRGCDSNTRCPCRHASFQDYIKLSDSNILDSVEGTNVTET